jgi:hypothetical protein
MSANVADEFAPIDDGLGDGLQSFGVVEDMGRAFLLEEALHLGRIGQMFGDVPDIGFKVTVNSAHGDRCLRYTV